jgi:hypothetical protein
MMGWQPVIQEHGGWIPPEYCQRKRGSFDTNTVTRHSILKYPPVGYFEEVGAAGRI